MDESAPHEDQCSRIVLPALAAQSRIALVKIITQPKSATIRVRQGEERLLELDPFEALALSMHHAPGVNAVLLGSGLSRSAGIPTGWEITLDLVRKVAALRGVKDQSDWAEWYRKEFEGEPSYSDLLDKIAATPDERRAILHQYIDGGDDTEAREPTKAHRAIARLIASGAIRVVVTTNFDRLLESALREVGVEPTVIAGADALKGATPLVHSNCTIIKVHGDYLDARILNTQDELEKYPKAIDALLDRVFDEYGLIVTGWSGDWDTALRKAILRTPSRRYQLFWSTRSPLSGLAKDIVDQRGGRVIEVDDADSFFEKLANAVDALDAARRVHPESVALTLALGKKYCRDDKFAMEWSELLQAEIAKIRSYVHGPDWPTSGTDAAAVRVVVSEILGRTEALRKLCMIGARWGTQSAKEMIERALAAMNFREKSMGGLTWLIEIRNLPAAICFQWALAGALYQRDYKMAGRLFRIPLKKGSEKVDAATQYWMSLITDINWKALEGFEKHKLPASGFLEKLFLEEAGLIVVDDSDALPLFDETEFLMSIEHAQRVVEKRGDDGWFWTPLGHFALGGRPKSLTDRLAELDSLDAKSPLLNAGLLGGSSETAQKVVAAYRRHLSKVGSPTFW